MYCVVCAKVASNSNYFTPEVIVSIIALIISIIAIALELYGAQRINIINLKSSFYTKIYDDYLINKIPVARRKILYNNNCVSNVDDLVKQLNDMRRSSLFFKYSDKNFYDGLVKKLQKLENELVEKCDKELEPDDFCGFNESLNNQLDDIYKFVLTKYTGKVFKNFFR